MKLKNQFAPPLTWGRMLAFLAIFLLAGCSLGYNTQSLDTYFLNSKYVQEQNNSSNKNSLKVPPSSSLLSQEGGDASEWVKKNYPKNCEWYDLDRVVDGDTVIVSPPPAPPSRGREKKVIRVRMIGIDTPESKKPGTPIEPYALAASAALKDLLKKETEVCLIADTIGDKIDVYGRTLSYVFRRDGLDVNARMIKDGWAQAYTRFPMERTKEFEGLERAARQGKVGQWE